MSPLSSGAGRPAPHWALVAAGGAIGSLLRHGVAATPLSPFATLLVVNGLGALAIGVLAARLVSSPDQDRWQAFVGLGVCGGFTTFSTHMVDVAHRLDRGELAGALASLASVAALAIAAAMVGHRLAAHRSATP